MIAKKIKIINLSLIILIILFIFSLVFFILFFFKKNQAFENKIYPYVLINGINFGKKDKSKVKAFFDKENKKLQKYQFSIVFKNDVVATFSAHQINLHYDSQGAAERAFLIGRSKHFPSRFYQQIATIFLKKSFSIFIYPSYDKQTVKEYLNILKEKYQYPAKNALFKFENGKVTAFQKEKNGLQIEEEKFLTDFDKTIFQIKNQPFQKKINLTYQIIQPEITLASSNKFGIEELIGQGQSNFSHSIPERIHNIILGSSKFNGILIKKGEILSFNKTIGDVSSLTGYKPAYIIKNGKTVLGDGGGICQISTTLFRAALNAGLPIVERHSHAYRVSYYENDAKPGLDATVFAPSIDLKIENNTPAYILIQTEVDKQNNLLYFYLYGKKDGRKIEMSQPILWDVVLPPEPKYQDDPTLKKDVIKQIDFPAWGGKANFHYKVIKNGEIIFEKDFFSVYKPWQAVFLVGTAD
ncbi:MAG: VanW family protein [Patescibacteria group bacterium]|nr:VanW family protein [Patescibacteria group bacterium]